MLQKQQKINLRHAKETAMIKADEFVRKKLADSKYAYEEEFEFICAQFEDIKKECESLTEEKE
jgi:hypothetical protein